MKRKLSAFWQSAAALMLAVSGLLVIIPAGQVAALGNVCVWTGNGADSNWSTVENWNDCADGAPTNGDELVFPSVADRKTNTNDLDNLSIVILSVFDDYNISGNAFTITDGIEADNTGGLSTTIANNLTFGPNGSGSSDDFVISHTTTNFGNLLLNGTISLATANDGEVIIVGGIVGLGDTSGSTGSITINDSQVSFGGASNFTVADAITMLNNSALFCGASDCLGNNSNPLAVEGTSTLLVHNDFTLNNPVTCSVTGADDCIYNNSAGSDIILEGPITLDGGTQGIGTQGSAGMTITINSDIDGTGNLSLGPGGIFVNGDNTFSGNVTVAGNVVLGSSTAFGDADNDVTVYDNTFGTLLQLDGVNYPYDTELHDNVIFGATGTSTAQIDGLISVVGDNVSISRTADATIAFNGGVNLDSRDIVFAGSASGAGEFWIFSPISGTGNVTYAGGSVIKAGDDTYVGDTTVSADTTVTSGQASAYGPAGNTVAVESGGTIVLAGSSNYTLAADVAGDGMVRLIGSGTREFTSLSGFTGTIDIEDDTTYRVDGNTAERVNVAINGGTLKGNGTVASVLLLHGALSPGDSPGIITVTDNLTLSASPAAFEVEINGTTAGTDYDQVVVGGTAELNNAKLDISLGFTPAAGDSFTILRADTVNGQFDGLADGDSFSVNGTVFTIHYIIDASGEDSVVLRVVGPSQGGGLLANTGQSILLAVIGGVTLISLAGATRFFKPRKVFSAI